MNPLLSIVTGTYNRHDYLKAMVESCRRQLPDGIAYEFVVVDGGSTDNTIAWCKEQPDIKLVRHDGLYGAIKAFTDGADAARGKYVVMANDDIRIQGYSLLRATAYLETHPDCGAVAFAENRVAPGYSADLHVQTLYAASEDGQPVDVPYAQVGMFRRWLGELALWWNMGDPLQSTYGGDSHLSAWLWEHGYTVDAVDGCFIDDQVAPDGLRERNYKIEAERGSAYYRKYPDGVHLNQYPKPEQQNKPRLRILMATLYDRGFGKYKSGLREAFQRVGMVVDIDWLNDPVGLRDTAEAWQPHVVFTQMCHPALMRDLRAKVPNAIIVNWFGDVHWEALTNPDMLEQCKYIDLQLTVNADVLPFYAKRGIRAAYWQVAPEPVDPLPSERSHDVLFMANNYSPARAELGAFLRTLPYDVGIYGANWNRAEGVTLYNFARGGALYARCKVAIGDSQYGDKGFVSNRLFEALYHGACLLHQTIPGLEDLTGLQAGVHYYAWDSHEQLAALIERLLGDEDARKQVAAAGQAYVKAHHTFDHRVAELLEMIRGLKK